MPNSTHPILTPMVGLAADSPALGQPDGAWRATVSCAARFPVGHQTRPPDRSRLAAWPETFQKTPPGTYPTALQKRQNTRRSNSINSSR